MKSLTFEAKGVLIENIYVYFCGINRENNIFAIECFTMNSFLQKSPFIV